jgi:hypothetical protein
MAGPDAGLVPVENDQQRTFIGTGTECIGRE